MRAYQSPKRHEKRWEQLVEPLLEKDGKGRSFLDLGCNEGFYMKKALKYGYRAKGVEKESFYINRADPDLNIKQADINYFNLPCAYVTLMANVHYHQSDEQISALLHNLMYSTVYLIVIGRLLNEKVRTDPRKKYIIRIMKGWKLIKETKGTKFYSLLLKSSHMDEFKIDPLYKATNDYTIKTDGVNDFFPLFSDFVRKTIEDPDFDSSAHPFMDYLARRKFSYRLGKCWIYKAMIKNIQKNGLTEPLRVIDGHLRDGHHRLVIAKELGYKRIVCRKLIR